MWFFLEPKQAYRKSFFSTAKNVGIACVCVLCANMGLAQKKNTKKNTKKKQIVRLLRNKNTQNTTAVKPKITTNTL